MPSNADLTAEAEALAQELKTEAVTAGLNNQQLAALVSDLKAKKRDADLTAEAEALAQELATEVTTDGLDSQQLAALVSDLKAKKRDAGAAAQADDAAKVAAREAEYRKNLADAKKPVEKKKPAYYLAPRKAIATKRGILSGDTEDEITVEDLPGGEAALDAFIESGHVLKG